MTFFLPIDAAFDVSIWKEYLSHNAKTNYWHIQNLRVELIDEDVVRAHIVPDELLFSLPPKRRPELYPTIQYNYTRGISNLEVKAKVNMKNRGKSHDIICASELLILICYTQDQLWNLKQWLAQSNTGEEQWRPILWRQIFLFRMGLFTSLTSHWLSWQTLSMNIFA